MEQAVNAGVPGNEGTEWARTTLARLLLDSGDIDAAKALYELSLASRPEYTFAMAGLAVIHRMEGNYQKSEELLFEALKAAPEVSFLEELVTTYRESGQNKAADEFYAGVIEMIEDDIAHGHRMDLELGQVLLNFANDPHGALEVAEICDARRPDNIDVNILMAEIYVALEEHDIALRYFETASRTGARYTKLDVLRKELGVGEI